jgi:hypothetical protein
MNYLEEVFRQTADGGYFDFARCQRADGSFYGTSGKCRQGNEVGAKEVQAAKSAKAAPVAPKAGKLGGAKVGTTKSLQALSLSQLKQLREDPRLYKYQQQKIDDIIAKKGGEGAKPTTKRDAAAREERRADIRERVKIQEGSKYNKTLEDVDRSYKLMRDFVKHPGMDTPENRAALTAMRALRMKMVYAQIQKFRATAKAKTEGLANSPKYEKVPGSSKPADPAKLGEKVREYLALKRDAEARQKQLDELAKLPWEERKNKGYQEIDDLHSMSVGAMTRLSRQRDFLDLKTIYEAQGYNAKPELVAKRSDLEKRTDLITRDNGKPLIMYRGVMAEEFADQFRGVGPNGGNHFAGTGIFGNGTYAASAPPKGDDITAQKTAKEYAGWGGTPAMITAFGLRRDANVVDFNQGSSVERQNAFGSWATDIRSSASQRTGLPVEDIGHAAAIMGVHAYRVPQDDNEDYWVILNRGAVVAAADAQL